MKPDSPVTNVAMSMLKNTTWSNTSKSSIKTFGTNVRNVQSLSTHQGVLWMFIFKLSIEVKNSNAPNAKLSMLTDMNMFNICVPFTWELDTIVTYVAMNSGPKCL